MDIQNIPWPTIEARLSALRHNQAWLARELNVGTNVVANWRSRGGAPVARAPELAKLLRCSLDDLLARPDQAHREAKKSVSQSATSKERQAALLATFEKLSEESRLELERYATYLGARDRGAA